MLNSGRRPKRRRGVRFQSTDQYDDETHDDDCPMQIEAGSLPSANDVDEDGAADTEMGGLGAYADEEADGSDSDFDLDDDSSERSFEIDDDDRLMHDLVDRDPECPEPLEQSNQETDDDAEDANRNAVDEEGPPIILPQDAGYQDDGTKNDEYNNWRGMQYDAETGKFRWDPDRTNTDELSEVPKPSQWTRVPPSKMKEIKVTFNEGREVLLDQYIEEHKAYLARLEELNIPKSKEGLFNHLFGEKSRFAHAMTRTLDISYEEFAKFIATVGFTAEFNQSAARLEEDSRINFSGYMGASLCNEIWRKIATVGKDGSGDKLWAQLEEALNRDCRELFLTGKEKVSTMRIALDDDKVHFHFSLDALRGDREFLVGMKGCQHVKANCRGFTIHSAVSSATGNPLNFSVERSGDTSTSVYDRMVRFMFDHAFTNGGAIHEALRGVTFCSDRGYWDPTVIIFLLGFAATVFGTWKRAYWNPFTYNQTTKLGGRQVIDTRFGRSVYNSFSVWKDTMIKAVAWRSGTGKVSIAATSDVSSANANEVQKIDFTFKSGVDAKWYRDESISQAERDLKAFPEIEAIGAVEDEELWSIVETHLLSLPVKMLTMSDLDTMWFELRKFSWTSSSVDHTLRSAAPVIDPNDPIYQDFLLTLTYGGMSGILKGDTNEEIDESDSESNSDNGNDLMSAVKVKDILQLLRGKVSATTLEDCIDNVDRMNQACNSTPSSQLTSMLIALGHDRSRADLDKQKQITLFKKWTKTVKKTSTHVKLLPPSVSGSDDDDTSECSSSSSSCEFYEYSFPYDMLNAKDLTNVLAMRMGGHRYIASGSVPGPHRKPANKKQRVEALLYLDKHPNEVQNQDEEADEDLLLSDLTREIIGGVIKRAFLKPHKDMADKSATRFGHQNEMPYLKQYYDDSRNGLVPDIDIFHIRNCGLAMQTEREYVRDSADAIAFENIGFESLDSHPVECKCRSGGGYRGSVKKAMDIQKRIAELEGRDGRRRLVSGKGAVYAVVKSSDTDKMKELLPNSHERIQLLHHAFCYGKKKATLLVGKSDGRLLYGLVVQFEDELLESYGRILDHLYKNGLKQFYEDDTSKLPTKLIENIILGDDKLKQKFQLDDFFTSFLTFQALIPSKSKANFPIPPCEKGIPFEHSLWNGSKGGSDTVTRFTYNCQVVLPIRTPQTVVSARLLMLYMVLYHRGCQAVTMRKQPDADIDTLKTIRDRNNKRIAFHSTLQYLCSLLLQNATSATTSSAGEVQEEDANKPLVEPAPRATRSNRAWRHETDDRITEAAGRTGATPGGRGKPLRPKNPSAEFALFQRRAQVCPGRPMKVGKLKQKRGQDGKIQFVRRVCALCGTEGCSYECNGCHQALCFDTDRCIALSEALSSDRELEIKAKAPGLKSLTSGDVPAKWCRAGETKKGSGEYKYVLKTCFHHCHPNYLIDIDLNLESDDDASDVDEQLERVSQNASSLNSPEAAA